MPYNPSAAPLGADTSPVAAAQAPPASPVAQPPTPADMGVLRDKVSTALGAGYSAAEIVAHVSQAGSPYASKFAAATQAGYSPDEIIDHLNGTSGGALQGSPIIAPIARGAAHAMDGVANLATDVGFPGVGAAIRGRINQEDLNATQSGASLISNLKAGRLGAALGNLPSAVLEQAPQIGGALVAGAATGGAADAAALPAWLAPLVRPAVARALGGGAVSALAGGDAVARARAMNNGEATPSAGDLVAGVAGAGAAGAVGSVGLGSGWPGWALASHTAADAAEPELNALAGSVGTVRGTQNASPADIAAGALTGAATRGAMAVPALASTTLSSLSPVARQATLRAAYAGLGDTAQQNARVTAAAGQALRAASTAADGTTLSTPDAANAAIGSTSSGVLQLIGALGKQGVIGGDEGKTIGTALRAAASSTENLTPQHLQDIAALQLDQPTHEALTGALQVINKLSGATSAQAPGPVQGALEAASGPIGGALLGGLEGGGSGAVAGAMLGHVVRPALSGALGGIGAKLDGVLGLAKPSLVLQANRAASLLRAAGQPIPDTRGDLMTAIAASQGALAAQRRILGLAPSPGATPASTTPSGGPAFDALAQQQSADLANVPTANSGKVVGPVATPGAPGVPGEGAAGPVGATVAAGPQGGLSGPAALQAARLSPHVYALGAALQSALGASGLARPVNMAGEVNAALDRLQAKGMLEGDVAEALKSHQGRVVPMVYGLIRNEMLMHNGIDRRTSEAQQGDVEDNVVPLMNAAE